MSSHLESHNLFESPTVQSCLFALQKLVSMRYPTHPGGIIGYLTDGQSFNELISLQGRRLSI